MTIDELNGEILALLEIRQWLQDKLLVVDIDIARNEEKREEIILAMEKTYTEGDYNGNDL